MNNVLRLALCVYSCLMLLAVPVGAVHADEGKTELPPAVTKTWKERFQNAEIVSVKEKDEGYEIKAKDALNDSFKVVIKSDGKLCCENKHKIALDAVPTAVLHTAKAWAGGAEWLEPVVVQTKKGEETIYEMTAVLHGEKYKTRIQQDGNQIEADNIPAPAHPPGWDKPGPKIDHVNRVIRCC
jgi:hypothetical protein